MKYYAYVLYNSVVKKIYIGQTSDLENRIIWHNKIKKDKKAFTSRTKGAWKLVYTEEFLTRVEAVKREKQLKSSRGRVYIKSEVLKLVL